MAHPHQQEYKFERPRSTSFSPASPFDFEHHHHYASPPGFPSSAPGANLLASVSGMVAPAAHLHAHQYAPSPIPQHVTHPHGHHHHYAPPGGQDPYVYHGHNASLSSVQLSATHMVEPLELAPARYAHPQHQARNLGWDTGYMSSSPSDYSRPRGASTSTSLSDAASSPVSPRANPLTTSAPAISTPVVPSQGQSIGTTISAGTAAAGKSRREASMAVIACRQCRARKIRCDSTRPVCNNCVRRCNECQYDAVPKRRGPDKVPGTRKRTCKKREKTDKDDDADDAKAGDKGTDMDNVKVEDAAGEGISATGEPEPRKKRRRVNSGGSGSSTGADTPVKGVKENVTSRPRAATTSALPARRQPPARPTINTAVSPPGLATPHASSPVVLRSAPAASFFAPQVNISKSFARPVDVNVHAYQPVPSNTKPWLYQPNPNATPPPGATPISLYGGAVGHGDWWEELIAQYSVTSREQSFKAITTDLSFLFGSTSYFMCFINEALFLRALSSAEARAHVQPALIYAGLALATLIKSSELELGAAGRNRAMWLRDAAQQHLEKSWASGWIDLGLAQAAMVMAIFEASAHGEFTLEREWNAIALVDRIVQHLGLAALDEANPATTLFAPGTVPVVNTQHEPQFFAAHDSQGSSPTTPPRSATPPRCACASLRAGASSWSWTPPPWMREWTDDEVRREEARRLVWTALMLVANRAAQSVVHGGQDRVAKLFLMEPSNYRLLFPGEYGDLETVARSPRSPTRAHLSSKDGLWALHCRTLLLWVSCFVNLGETAFNPPPDERADFAVEAWQELQATEDTLQMHVCNSNIALRYMAFEYLHHSRLLLTRTLRRYQGVLADAPAVFPRRQAEHWISYNEQSVKLIKGASHHLGEPEGYFFTRQPWQLSWFGAQVATCISLWESDHTLGSALELAKAFLGPLDILNALWPCPGQRGRSHELRAKLEEACTAARTPVPLPPDFSLPPILRQARA